MFYLHKSKSKLPIGFIGNSSVKALHHEHDGESADSGVASRIWTDEQIETEVDLILADFDANRDGFIDFSEYSKWLYK